MSAAATHEANRSYRDVLRNRHVAGLLLGDLLANVGTGMIIVAMPVQTLSIHGNVPNQITSSPPQRARNRQGADRAGPPTTDVP